MSYLTAAAVFAGILSALNLILTLGVIRRLREHSELFSAIRSRPGPPAGPTVGAEIGAFHASTVDGEELTAERVTDETLVAFFSPGCRPCNEKLPQFVSYARTIPGGRDRVLVTVVGDHQEAGPFVTDLSPVARVVVEDVDGPLGRAFGVVSYPMALWVAPGDDGRLVVTADEIKMDQPVATPT